MNSSSINAWGSIAILDKVEMFKDEVFQNEEFLIDRRHCL